MTTAAKFTGRERFRFIKVYKASVYEVDKVSAEVCYGNRIQMPETALMELHLNEYQYPFMFRLTNCEWSTHCGVRDFNAPPGKILLPPWMMRQLNLTDGQNICLEKVNLPAGEFLKIAPLKVDFFHDIPEPFKELEIQLKNFTCLTVGDVITIRHKFKEYEVLIRELKPQKAVCVIDTTMNLDFDVPPDYYQQAKSKAIERLLAKDVGHRLGKRPITIESTKLKHWWSKRNKNKSQAEVSKVKVNAAFDQDSIDRRRSMVAKNSLTVLTIKRRSSIVNNKTKNRSKGKEKFHGKSSKDKLEQEEDNEVEYRRRRLSLIKRGEPDFDFKIGSIYFTRNLEYFDSLDVSHSKSIHNQTTPS